MRPPHQAVDLPRIPLSELLHNSAAVGYLLEYMSQTGSADALNLWLAIEAFRETDMRAAKPDDLLKDAQGLFKTYGRRSRARVCAHVCPTRALTATEAPRRSLLVRSPGLCWTIRDAPPCSRPPTARSRSCARSLRTRQTRWCCLTASSPSKKRSGWPRRAFR